MREVEDLASFLQIAMLNGWGGYVLAEVDYVNAFFSHDEYIDFFAERDELLSDVRKELGKNKHSSEDPARLRVPGSAPSTTGGHSEK